MGVTRYPVGRVYARYGPATGWVEEAVADVPVFKGLLKITGIPDRGMRLVDIIFFKDDCRYVWPNIRQHLWDLDQDDLRPSTEEEWTAMIALCEEVQPLGSTGRTRS